MDEPPIRLISKLTYKPMDEPPIRLTTLLTYERMDEPIVVSYEAPATRCAAIVASSTIRSSHHSSSSFYCFRRRIVFMACILLTPFSFPTKTLTQLHTTHTFVVLFF